MNSIQHRLEYAGLKSLMWIFSRFSLDRASAIGGGIARFVGPRLPFHKRVVRNLNHIYGDLAVSQQKEMSEKMYDNFARTMIEYVHQDPFAHDPSRISIQGIENLKAIAKDRGIIFISAHYGNWEAMRVRLIQEGHSIALLYRAFNNPFVTAEADRVMGAFGGHLFHKGRKGNLDLLRHVKKGGAAMILADQKSRHGIKIPFLGKEAMTSLAAAEIALNYNAAIIPILCRRRGQSSYFDMIIAPEIKAASGSLDPKEDISHQINQQLSQWVADQPDQWFWLHNRWGKLK